MISTIQKILFKFAQNKKLQSLLKGQKVQQFHRAVLSSKIIKLIQFRSCENKEHIQSYLKSKENFLKNKNQLESTQESSVTSDNQTKMDFVKSNDFFDRLKISDNIQDMSIKLEKPQKNQGNITLKKIELFEDQFLKMSLRAKVIKQIENYMKPQVPRTQEEIASGKYPEQKAKKYLMSYFIGGVWVHNIYCRQKRFQAGKKLIKISQLIKKNEIVDESFIQDGNIDDLYQKLTFWPSHMTTTKIFGSISQFESDKILTGHFGTGKTYSFVLYRLLSEMIFRYKYKYHKNQQQLPKEIDFDLMKLVYWNINLKQADDKNYKQFVQKLIMTQCYELKHYQPLQAGETNYQYQLFKEEKNNWQRLHNILQKMGIKVVLGCDQFNKSIAAIRNFKNYLILLNLSKNKNPYKKLKKDVQNGKKMLQQLVSLQNDIKNYLQQFFNQNEKNIKKNSKNARKVIEIISLLIPEFKSRIYLSSQTIQQNILKGLELNGQDKHSPIQITQVDYLQNLNSPETSADTVQFFIQNYKKFIQVIVPRPQQDTENSVQFTSQDKLFSFIRQKMISLLQNMEIIISPLTINTQFREAVKKKKINTYFNLLNKLIQAQGEQEIIKYLKSLIEQLKAAQIKSIQNQINNFIYKKYSKRITKDKLILFSRLLFQAQKRKQDRIEGLETTDYLEVDTKDLFQKQKTIFDQQKITNQNDPQDLLNIYYDSQQDFIVHLNSQFFYYDNKQFKCKIHENIIIQILNEKKNQMLAVLTEFKQKFFNLVQGNPSAQGILIENSIKKCIIQGSSFYLKRGKKSAQNQLNKTSPQDIQFKQIKFDDQNILFFHTIPQINLKNYNNFNFLEAFKETVFKLSDGNHLFFPKKKSSETEQKISTSQNSKLIDFILVKKQAKNVHIYAFDPTVSETYSSKVSRLLKQFSNFKDKQTTKIVYQGNQYEVLLNYYVICKDNLSEQKEKKVQWKNELQNAKGLIKNDLQKLKNQITNKQLQIQDLKNDVSKNHLSLTLEELKKEEKRQSILNKRLLNTKALSENLKNNLSYLQQIETTDQNPSKFGLKFKDNCQNKQLLLKEVGVYSFEQIDIENIKNFKKIEYYLNIFNFFKNNLKK